MWEWSVCVCVWNGNIKYISNLGTRSKMFASHWRGGSTLEGRLREWENLSPAFRRPQAFTCLSKGDLVPSSSWFQPDFQGPVLWPLLKTSEGRRRLMEQHSWSHPKLTKFCICSKDINEELSIKRFPVPLLTVQREEFLYEMRRKKILFSINWCVLPLTLSAGKLRGFCSVGPLLLWCCSASSVA